MPLQHPAADVRELQPVASQHFVQAMGQHVSSVCVITTSHDGGDFGLTATAVSSVCASPPRLLVCVNKTGTTQDKIAAAGVFCVNVLTEDQEPIAKGFAGMLGKEFDKFSLGAWSTLATGSPVLKGASASFDCKLVSDLDQFSHSIFIGEVVGVSTYSGKDALLYGARRFRALRKVFSADNSADLEALHFW
ncbi:flavin reductase family protein [Bradyrhizobium sp. PRIMUS42]|uniref:flavin reductase family protein n=1 Tax=Bradyrhizobium sp. PRIMUS42 TaxID=2908926 RepID=UPI001FF51CFD|nr:flavin reductase family protein [Bradyrhizobium sp. PRIMUS42]MCJ9730224.1 flavin reductase family protein [Bradyrhizobium sp. PRIMUS42]